MVAAAPYFGRLTRLPNFVEAIRRVKELTCAYRALGLQLPILLDYQDGHLAAEAFCRAGAPTAVSQN